jgi:hypothetical protein
VVAVLAIVENLPVEHGFDELELHWEQMLLILEGLIYPLVVRVI